MTQITNRSISSFLNNELKQYGKYVLETRCCPRLMDGLRTGARKIVYAGLVDDLSHKKNVKMLNLMGNVLRYEYHHGDSSLLNTIIQLSRSDIIKYKPLEVIGQVSDLRYDCKVAARYLEVSKDKGLEIFSADKELWDLMEEGGVKIEPKNFLPIIPMVLLYRTNSPGFGFSFRSFSYKIDSIIDLCIKAISEGTCVDHSVLNEIQLKPNVEGVKQNNFIYNFVKESWFSVGEYSFDFDSDTLTIFDLPYSVKLDSYAATLLSLKNRLIIKDWMNLSSGDSIKYVIKFDYGRLRTLYNANKWNFYQMFRLFSKVTKDTLNVLDDNNNILQIENPFQLIDIFVKNRLKIYDLRKVLTIENLKKKIKELSEIVKFINLVISGELIISKRPINDVKMDLDRFQLPYTVLKIAIEKLTKEEIQKLEKEIEELKNQLNYIETTSIKTMYINELIELKEKFGEPINNDYYIKIK